MNDWNQFKIPVGGGLKSRVILHNGVFNQIISLDNLFSAWYEFREGKRSKVDVQIFEYTLEDNIFQLYKELSSGTYQHGSYQQFRITDPKARIISKSSVRDRLLHKAIYRVLYPIFDKTFIFDSYSCRNNKGTHKAFTRLQTLARKISRNYTQPCFALKLDIKKFFDSVDHKILMDLLKERIEDERLLNLLTEIIESFSINHTEFNSASLENSGKILKQVQDDRYGKGMPLGNLTSQLFANIYLDPLDKFAKHILKAKYYLRYADDFIFLSCNPDELLGYLIEVNQFLKTKLKLNIHPNKIHLRKLNWGIDYVGYVTLPHYSLPRKKTIKRIVKRIGRLISEKNSDMLTKAVPSYLGYLQHANSYQIRAKLKELLYNSSLKV